jgi:hypothetical protein
MFIQPSLSRYRKRTVCIDVIDNAREGGDNDKRGQNFRSFEVRDQIFIRGHSLCVVLHWVVGCY